MEREGGEGGGGKQGENFAPMRSHVWPCFCLKDANYYGRGLVDRLVWDDGKFWMKGRQLFLSFPSGVGNVFVLFDVLSFVLFGQGFWGKCVGFSQSKRSGAEMEMFEKEGQLFYHTQGWRNK